MEKYAIYVPRLVKKEEKFAPGHRACIGCGEALAIRQAFKALDTNVIVVNATGCAEIFASQLPLTQLGATVDTHPIRKCGRRGFRHRGSL